MELQGVTEPKRANKYRYVTWTPNAHRETDMDSCILNAGHTSDYIKLLWPSDAYICQKTNYY